MKASLSFDSMINALKMARIRTHCKDMLELGSSAARTRREEFKSHVSAFKAFINHTNPWLMMQLTRLNVYAKFVPVWNVQITALEIMSYL